MVLYYQLFCLRSSLFREQIIFQHVIILQGKICWQKIWIWCINIFPMSMISFQRLGFCRQMRRISVSSSTTSVPRLLSLSLNRIARAKVYSWLETATGSFKESTTLPRGICTNRIWSMIWNSISEYTCLSRASILCAVSFTRKGSPDSRLKNTCRPKAATWIICACIWLTTPSTRRQTASFKIKTKQRLTWVTKGVLHLY